MRKIIQINEEKCDGCGLCVPACHEGAIAIVDGKARLIADNLCDGIGDCLGDCPQDAITIIEREALPYDEKAVEKHLAAARSAESAPPAPPAGGCPGAAMREFAKSGRKNSDPMNSAGTETGERPAAGRSALSHWPIKMELIPPHAPFLKDADIIFTADCAPVALTSFNERFLENKAIILACPKFGDLDLFMDRLTGIVKEALPRSITVIHMEVPCCTGLLVVAREAIKASGLPIPFEAIQVSLQGEILSSGPVPLVPQNNA